MNEEICETELNADKTDPSSELATTKAAEMLSGFSDARRRLLKQITAAGGGSKT